jgi:hypothetical protein
MLMFLVTILIVFALYRLFFSEIEY